MIGFGRHPRNLFYGHVRRQDAAGARFRDLIMGNVRPAARAQYGGETKATREYGSTDPVQSFPIAVRVNRRDTIEATGYQVPKVIGSQRASQRPDPRTPAKIGFGK